MKYLNEIKNYNLINCKFFIQSDRCRYSRSTLFILFDSVDVC